MATYAKVAIESPLPQLDRLFDYLVPDGLQQQIAVGQRVRVPFGKAGKLLVGFVVELSDSIDFAGAVNSINEIVSNHVVLPSNLYRLIRAVADRQAVTFGDVAKAAIPNFMLRASKSIAQEPLVQQDLSAEISLQASLSEPIMKSASFGEISIFESAWILDFVDASLDNVALGQSTILCVPDYRDVARLEQVFERLEISGLVIVVGSDQANSVRYTNHIRATQGAPHIVIGTRSALFAPVQNLGQILVWDDEDQSHNDQASPYVSSREVALIRQTVDSCSLSFHAHSRSLAVQRLVKLGYLKDVSQNWQRPKVAFSENDVRVNTLAFSTVKAGLKSGPVLVQVSNLGTAKSAYCSGCSNRATCQHCAGPLWIDQAGKPRCRWCNGFNLAFKCNACGVGKLRMGRAGSTRTASELGRAFPGVQIVEATGESVVTQVDASPKIVIATPGAEPVAIGGYFGIVVLDCDVALARDTLKAREEAIRVWSNAIAMGNSECHSALIGIKSELGALVCTWQLIHFAELELSERESLGFPPAARILSAVGLKDLVTIFAENVVNIDGCSVLGLAPTEASEEWQALIRFSYASGADVADFTRAFQLKNAGQKRVNSRSGQNQRAVSIKIDDPRVL